MKVNKAHSRRSLSLLLTLVLLLTFLSGVAVASAEEEVDFAVIDPTKTGSITVTKYATKYSATNSNPPKGEATGTSGDVGSIDSGYEPLGGAVFKLFNSREIKLRLLVLDVLQLQSDVIQHIDDGSQQLALLLLGVQLHALGQALQIGDLLSDFHSGMLLS